MLYCYITVFKVRITFDISIMKEEETTHPRNNSEIQLSNLRKRQNRCPDTQIHDCSLFCHGTGMSLMKGNMSRRMHICVHILKQVSFVLICFATIKTVIIHKNLNPRRESFY